MGNKQFTIIVVFALIVAALAISPSINMSRAFTPSTFQVSVESPQNESTIAAGFSVTFSFAVTSNQTFAGIEVSPGDYLINGATEVNGLFRCSIIAGCIVDYDRAQVVSLIANDSGSYEETQAFVAQSDTAFLSYAGGDLYNGTATLTGLTEGTHTMIVWVKAVQNYMSFNADVWSAFSETVTFTVSNTTYGSPPKVTILAPQNTTYRTSDVPLDFTVNEPTSRLLYVLDGNESALSQNRTMTGLALGMHNLTISAWDTTGTKVVSESVNFTVAEPATPTPSASALPSPSVPELSIWMILPLIIIATLTAAYLRKRKMENVSLNTSRSGANEE